MRALETLHCLDHFVTIIIGRFVVSHIGKRHQAFLHLRDDRVDKAGVGGIDLWRFGRLHRRGG